MSWAHARQRLTRSNLSPVTSQTFGLTQASISEIDSRTPIYHRAHMVRLFSSYWQCQAELVYHIPSPDS